MHQPANHGDPSIVVLSPEQRTELGRQLDIYLEMQAHEQAGLIAIEDREHVRDAWALLDLLNGDAFDRSRVERIVRAMAVDSDQELGGLTSPRARISAQRHAAEDQLAEDVDCELEARASFAAVLAQVGEGVLNGD